MSLQGIIGTQLSSDFGRSPGITFHMFPDFPFGGRDRHLLSAVSQRGALSFFVILSRIAGCAVNIGLVASQCMRNIFQHLTAVVDTAVALFGYPELSDQLKIGESSSLPDNASVGFQTVSRFRSEHRRVGK